MTIIFFFNKFYDLNFNFFLDILNFANLSYFVPHQKLWVGYQTVKHVSRDNMNFCHS